MKVYLRHDCPEGCETPGYEFTVWPTLYGHSNSYELPRPRCRQTHVELTQVRIEED